MNILLLSKTNFLYKELLKEKTFNITLIDSNFTLLEESKKRDSIIFLHHLDSDKEYEKTVSLVVNEKNINALAIRNAPNNIEGCSLLKDGYKAYIHSMSNIEILKSAIESVKSGNSWVYPELMQFLINIVPAQNSRDEEKLKSLTIKEREVLELVSKGHSNAKIASILNVAEVTIKKHISSLFSKLGVKDRLSLALFDKKD